jgi:hypothetical protein
MPFTGSCAWCGSHYSHDHGGILKSEYSIGKRNFLGLRVIQKTFCSPKCKRDHIDQHGLRDGES